MGLNVSNEQMAHELSLNESDVQQMTAQLPAFSANNPPTHAREKGQKSFPGAVLPAGEGVQSAR
jgi:hypothetical protein